MAWSRSPNVSTRMCRFLPLIFLPASYPCGSMQTPLFPRFSADNDVYMLAHVLHAWTDAQALSILRNCRKAIPRQGRLLIAESVLPPGDTPHQGKLMDLLMLTVTG